MYVHVLPSKHRDMQHKLRFLHIIGPYDYCLVYSCRQIDCLYILIYIEKADAVIVPLYKIWTQFEAIKTSVWKLSSTCLDIW